MSRSCRWLIYGSNEQRPFDNFPVRSSIGISEEIYIVSKTYSKKETSNSRVDRNEEVDVKEHTQSRRS